MYMVLLPVGMLAGCLLAVQASVNQQLNKAVGTPYGASTMQLSVAGAALAMLAAATGAIGALSTIPQVTPLWLLLGGLASPLYITAGILLFPRLGALTAVGLFVTGQVVASMVLDVFGLLAVPTRPVNIGIVFGGVAVLAGITVVIRGQRLTVPHAERPARPDTRPPDTRPPDTRPPDTPPDSRPPVSEAAPRSPGPGWILLGLLAGAALPVQGAVNAQLKEQVEAPLAVGTISFAVATLAIGTVLAAMLVAGRTSTPRLRTLRCMPWWGWLGGICAAAYVTATFLLIPTVGAAVTIALTVTGQQLASALIDQFGWLGMSRRPLTGPRLVGLGLLVAGSVLVQLT
jgi:bacterial/archaeal transporter family-2 protein